MATGLTRAEAEARAALLDVESYAVALDLATDPGAVRSHTEIRFRCRQPGAATFADIATATVSRVVLNGQRLDPGTVLGGRLRLHGLAARDVLMVNAEFPRSPGGPGLLWFTDPADGAPYVLGKCFPTDAPKVFCCFDQPDLRADLTLDVQAPAGLRGQRRGDRRPSRRRGGAVAVRHRGRDETVRADAVCRALRHRPAARSTAAPAAPSR